MFSQQQQPWWKSVAQMGAGAANGAMGQRPNPIGDLAQNAGNFGTALQGFLKKRQMGKNQQAGLDAGDPSAEQGVQDAINSTLQPAPVGTEPMADGQIVTKPTLVMLGEHEPEAVVPLTDRPNAKVRPSVMGRRYYGEG